MKSIYSLFVLQRILDHWGVGKIEDVTYFEKVGRNIWRHHIDSNQGVFELYSYPVETREYAEIKLKEFVEDRHWHHIKQFQRTKIVHSFERYHRLIQFSQKHKITTKQACKDLELLIGSTIKKAFRVYGGIIQFELSSKITIVSYGFWNLQISRKGRQEVIIDNPSSSYAKIDKQIAIFEKNQVKIKDYLLNGGWFELYLSNNFSLHFNRGWDFPAAELYIPTRKNQIKIFEENEIYYSKDFRDK